MIRVPTVLVLGAGASTHLEYPLGNVLLQLVCQVNGKPEFAGVQERFGADHVRAFVTHMAECGDSSIDAYLARCEPSDLAMGKYLIAAHLKQYERKRELTMEGIGGGWYRDLFNALVDGDLENLGDHGLTIVTFNYDRSLEAYLHTRLAARFRLTPELATEYLHKIPIIHVHGILGSFPEFP